MTKARFARGFTLVEVLVVVLLVAITVSFAVVKLAPDDRETVLGEAARLAVSLQQAQDEVILTGAGLAWRGEPKGYRYLRRGPDRSWVPLENDQAFSQREWPLPVRLVDVEVGGLKVSPGALVVLSPAALTSPVRIVLEANSARAAVEVGASARVVQDHGR
jgi:type II secretion system protein H